MLRVAAWNGQLSRDGPGLLLRDILGGEDPQIEMGAAMIAEVDADLLLVTAFDYDAGLIAARAFADRIRAKGTDYPYVFAFRPNTGLATELDLNGDGYTAGPADAQGYGEFAGQSGMVLFSKLPFKADRAVDFSAFKWSALPGNLIDDDLPKGVADHLRMSSVGHWQVPVQLAENEALTLLAWHAGTPVFDGPEDLNGRRNHDENLFWVHLFDGAMPFAPPAAPFVLLGTSNLDPADGEGRQSAIHRLLDHPSIQDPEPRSNGARLAGEDGNHRGDPALDTADWRERNGPGNLRVQYVLPSAELDVEGAGVFWPAPTEEGYEIVSGRDPGRSWHGIVWVDIVR